MPPTQISPETIWKKQEDTQKKQRTICREIQNKEIKTQDPKRMAEDRSMSGRDCSLSRVPDGPGWE